MLVSKIQILARMKEVESKKFSVLKLNCETNSSKESLRDKSYNKLHGWAKNDRNGVSPAEFRCQIRDFGKLNKWKQIRRERMRLIVLVWPLEIQKVYGRDDVYHWRERGKESEKC
jgi:hypothetical protein